MADPVNNFSPLTPEQQAMSMEAMSTIASARRSIDNM